MAAIAGFKVGTGARSCYGMYLGISRTYNPVFRLLLHVTDKI